MKRFLVRLLLSVVITLWLIAFIKSQITPQVSEEMETLERLTQDFYQPGKIEIYQTSWNVNHTKLCGSLDYKAKEAVRFNPASEQIFRDSFTPYVSLSRMRVRNGMKNRVLLNIHDAVNLKRNRRAVFFATEDRRNVFATDMGSQSFCSFRLAASLTLPEPVKGRIFKFSW